MGEKISSSNTNVKMRIRNVLSEEREQVASGGAAPRESIKHSEDHPVVGGQEPGFIDSGAAITVNRGKCGHFGELFSRIDGGWAPKK